MKTQTMEQFKRASYVILSFFLLIQITIPLGVYASQQQDPPGNNGTLKVHEYATPSDSENNDPKVCIFNFEGFGLDANQTGNITIETQSGSPIITPILVALTTNEMGYGETVYINNGGVMTLANGHYKATLDKKFGTDNGDKAKSKVFKVECAEAEKGNIKVKKEVDQGDGNGFVSDNPSQHGFLWGIEQEIPGREFGTTVSDLVKDDGPYLITENTVAGYQYVGWYDGNDSCNEPDGTDFPSIAIRKDSTRHITLCNKKISINETSFGSITIIKDAIPNHEEDFDFEITGNQLDEEFTLDDDAGAIDGDDEYSNLQSFADLTTGTYSVAEEEDGDWELIDITCTGGSQTSYNQQTEALDIYLTTGENITCTFTNKLKTSLTVVKDASPESPDDFTFSLSNYDDFMLDDDDDSTLSNEKLFQLIEPGEYTLSEAEYEGWVLDDIDCTGIDSDDFVVDLNKRQVALKISYGDEIECEFENEKPGDGGGGSSRLYGYKFNDFNGDSEWGDDEQGIENWTINLYKYNCEIIDLPSVLTFAVAELEQDCEYALVDSTQTDQNGQYIFNISSAGDYKICEEMVSEWTQTLPGDNGCYYFSTYESQFIGPYNFGNQNRPHSITTDVSAVCRSNFPYLIWSVRPVNFTPTQFKLEWLTVNGNNAGQSAGNLVTTNNYDVSDVDYNSDTNTYSGETLWPGASTTLPDWPGWEFVDGQWVENANDFGGNLRPAADVQISVNPTVNTPSAYPDANSSCNPTQPQVLGTSTLVNTGAPLAHNIIFGITILTMLTGITFSTKRRTILKK